MRRERDEPDVAGCGVLPTREFIEVGWTNPLGGMGSTRSLFGADMRAFNVKSGDRATAGQGDLARDAGCGDWRALRREVR